MKIIITIISLIFTIMVSGQEKQRVIAPHYNVKYANITLENGVTYKVIQEKMIKKPIKMMGKQYNQFYDPNIDNGEYFMIKILRVRPLNIDFFNHNLLLEYFANSKGKHIIVKQVVSNNLRLVK